MSNSVQDIGDLDAWVQLLLNCKQLPENDVKKLCEKVGNLMDGQLNPNTNTSIYLSVIRLEKS